MDNRRETLPSDKMATPNWLRVADYLVSHQRSILVLVLAVALVLFLAWLPNDTRLALLIGLLSQRILVGLLLFFSLLTLSLLWSAGQRIDDKVFLYFNQHQMRRVWLDWFMWGATQIGNGVVGLGLAGILFLLRQRRLAIELVLGILSLWLVVEIIKALTDRARPYLAIAETQIVGWRERGKSFPSGHTSQTFFMMSLLIHHFQPNPLVGLLLYAVAILVGFTRLYVGVHFPRDVVGGAILGSVWGILAALLDSYLVGRLV